MKNKLRSQSLSEYSIFLAIIFLAFAGMNIYVKRGLQGRYRDAVNEATLAISEEAPQVSVKPQYEPYYANLENTVNISRIMSKTLSEVDKGKIINPGKATRNLSSQPVQVERASKEGVNVEGSQVITW